MRNIKLRSAYLDGKWYEIKTFLSIEECNQFLEKHKDFGLLVVKTNYEGKPVHCVAKKTDLGQDKLPIYFESEDRGFCQKYYKAKCGRLYVMIPEGLHTCADDGWREPDTPVDENLFIIHEE